MKQLRNFFILFAVAAGLVLILESCETEPVTPNGPTISAVLSSGADTLTVFEDSVFTVQVTTTAGDAVLSQINVKQDGQNVDIARLVFDGDPAGGNPSPLAEAFNNGFTWDIDITADMSALSTYEIIIVDTDGLRDTATFDIFTVAAFTGTPVDTMGMVMLLNQGGPAGTGGLDLETGQGLGTQASDTDGDLHDNGIDTNLPVPQNWLQTFKPANGADLRLPDASVVYEEVTTKEEIASIYEAGTSITVTAEKVQTGEVYVVRTGSGNDFLLKVTNVVVTTDNNNDFYEFEVKF